MLRIVNNRTIGNKTLFHLLIWLMAYNWRKGDIKAYYIINSIKKSSPKENYLIWPKSLSLMKPCYNLYSPSHLSISLKTIYENYQFNLKYCSLFLLIKESLNSNCKIMTLTFCKTTLLNRLQAEYFLTNLADLKSSKKFWIKIIVTYKNWKKLRAFSKRMIILEI